MAKSALIPILSLSLFLLFSLSHSDVLLLPSDNPHPVLPDDTAAVPDPKSTIADPDRDRDGFVTVPLTKLDFHEGNIPLSLRFPHKRRFGRGCRHGYMLRRGMRRPRRVSYGNDVIFPDGKDGEFTGRSRFHWVDRRPRFVWKGEEGLFDRREKFEHRHDEEEGSFKRMKKFGRGHDDDEEEEMFKRPRTFERGPDEEGMFGRPKNFRHHDDDDDDAFRRPEKFDLTFETVKKMEHDDDDHMFGMPRKFKHDDEDEDWHGEKHHHRRFGPHHHKHHHHGDDEDDNKGGILSKMRKFLDKLF